MIDKVKALIPVIQEVIRIDTLHTNESEIRNEEIKNYLNQFTDEDVALIRAVMYVGREQFHGMDSVNESASSLKTFYEGNLRSDDKELNISQLLEKRKLSDYLREGLKSLSIA